MQKLIVICGPTATGKTGLAFYLAEKYSGEIISADSRQVYKKMDIGTGKDIPKGSKYKESQISFKGKNIGYYQYKKIKLWGYDLVSFRDQFSVSDYSRVVFKILKKINKKGKTAILVGGTGLYIRAITDGIDTIDIPANQAIRESYKEKSASELFEILSTLDPVVSASMNQSDRNNPRRLLRAIEVAIFKQKDTKLVPINKPIFDGLFVGLMASREFLFQKVEKRVRKRLSQGFEKELKDLLVLGANWDMQSMKSLGYRQWKNYFLGKEDRSSAIERWVSEEKKYVKRQIVWFKKEKRIKWFDIRSRDLKHEVEKYIRKCYIKD